MNSTRVSYSICRRYIRKYPNRLTHHQNTVAHPELTIVAETSDPSNGPVKSHTKMPVSIKKPIPPTTPNFASSRHNSFTSATMRSHRFCNIAPPEGQSCQYRGKTGRRYSSRWTLGNS